MTGPRIVLAAAAVLALGLVVATRSGLFSHEAPAGQPPLAEMDAQSMEALKAEFNRAKDEYRVIALFSPT
jgi:hypothetical protein